LLTAALLAHPKRRCLQQQQALLAAPSRSMASCPSLRPATGQV
jgi:hypothetical protein